MEEQTEGRRLLPNKDASERIAQKSKCHLNPMRRDEPHIQTHWSSYTEVMWCGGWTAQSLYLLSELWLQLKKWKVSYFLKNNKVFLISTNCWIVPHLQNLMNEWMTMTLTSSCFYNNMDEKSSPFYTINCSEWCNPGTFICVCVWCTYMHLKQEVRKCRLMQIKWQRYLNYLVKCSFSHSACYQMFQLQPYYIFSCKQHNNKNDLCVYFKSCVCNKDSCLHSWLLFWRGSPNRRKGLTAFSSAQCLVFFFFFLASASGSQQQNSGFSNRS